MAKKCLYITLISVSAVFLALSVGSLILFSNIDYFINEQVKKQAPLVDGSKPFENWSKPKDDTTFMFTLYLFHVVNPDGYQQGELPIVKEFGPYDFKQKKIFDIIGWDSNENRLTYRMKRVFYRDESCRGNLNDKVTVLNVPLISLSNILNLKLQKLPSYARIPAELFAASILKNYDPFVTQKVGDLLFNGYKDKFTTLVEELITRFKLKVEGPQSIDKNGYFSLLGLKNNSDYGLMTIDTGKEDLGELGKLVYLDGQVKVNCWTGDCSNLHGTDGLIHHPFINDDDTLSVFEPELNRTVFLHYEKDTEYQGVPTKRFLLSASTYNAPENNPYNKCFCPTNDKIGKRDGVLRSGHCNFNVPMVFSNPHFYQGDKYFRDRIKGFKPIKEKHESFADIPKELGMVINGRKTVQLNFDNQAYAHLVMTTKYHKQIEREIFPVLWLADSGAAGPSSISELKEELYDKVSNIKKYLIIFSAVFIAGFIVPLIYLAIDVYLRWSKPEDDRQHIITSHDSFSNLNNSPYTSTIRHASVDADNEPKVEIKEDCHDSAVEV